MSQIQCFEISESLGKDQIIISDTYDAETDTNTIRTRVQVHVPNVMNIADDSLIHESYATKRNPNLVAFDSDGQPFSFTNSDSGSKSLIQEA